jgi:leucyl aminopeptidase (aminopeptidase T)
MAQATETSTGLRPETIQIVDLIYTQMCNLQPDTNVLVIADSRTPTWVVRAFMGGAMAIGARAMIAESATPPPPSVQPSIVWNSMVAAAAKEADLIVDLAVGYAQFIDEALARGARVITPGDGTGGHHIEESLIRTLLAADVHALRREADELADAFTQASTCYITSEEGTDIVIDLDSIEGEANDGFLWDPDKGAWKSSWAIVPPAQPGVLLPKGRGNGVIAVDGFLLYEPAYDHETPTGPVFVTIEDGKIVDIAGHPLFAGRLRHWLDEQPDDSASYGPVHVNLGTNPRAMLTQHLEFERIRGTIVFGFGDSSMSMMLGPGFEPVHSHVHWDLLIMRPTMTLDGQAIVENGIM